MKSLNEIKEEIGQLNEITDQEQLFYQDSTKVYKSQRVKGLQFEKRGGYKKPIKLTLKGKEIGEVTYDGDKDHFMVQMNDKKLSKSLDHAGLKAQGWNNI